MTKNCEHCQKPFCTPASRKRFCSSLCSNRFNAKFLEVADPIANFWSYVDKEGTEHPTLGKCWVWTAGTTRGGYGHAHVNGKHYRAHRFSWEITHGEIKEDLHVLHHCDNPPCVNPAHLFLGTEKDNAIDKCQKGRHVAPKGSRSGAAKLTEHQVLEIRKLYEIERKPRKIAKLFGVKRGTVRSVVKGLTWKHI